MWHIFISSKWLHQICTVLTLLVGEKTCLADARHTLVAAGSQKHFIYVWMAAGVQLCLAQTVCCGLWHPFASLQSPWHKLSPSLLLLRCILCVYTGYSISMYVNICCVLLVIFLWTTVKIFSTLHVTWKWHAVAMLCINISQTLLSQLFSPN